MPRCEREERRGSLPLHVPPAAPDARDPADRHALTTFTYNLADRMVSASANGESETYARLGDGVRLSATSGGSRAGRVSQDDARPGRHEWQSHLGKRTLCQLSDSRSERAHGAAGSLVIMAGRVAPASDIANA
jgi:hypothetical protein